MSHFSSSPPARQPAFNAPGCILALMLVMAAIHAVRLWVLGPEQDIDILTWFAFIPVRYDVPEGAFLSPEGLGPRIWTVVTYALLHGSWAHLLMNLVWFVAFGTPVARRFGAVRFYLFCAVTAAAGAGAHYLTHSEALVPMVGASAAISGVMAGAIRFTFAPGGSLSGQWSPHPADQNPAHSLRENFGDRRVLVFVLFWVGLNVLTGLGFAMPGSDGGEIAWQAHVGGFLAGILLFGLFDPVPRWRRR